MRHLVTPRHSQDSRPWLRLVGVRVAAARWRRRHPRRHPQRHPCQLRRARGGRAPETTTRGPSGERRARARGFGTRMQRLGDLSTPESMRVGSMPWALAGMRMAPSGVREPRGMSAAARGETGTGPWWLGRLRDTTRHSDHAACVRRRSNALRCPCGCAMAHAFLLST